VFSRAGTIRSVFVIQDSIRRKTTKLLNMMCLKQAFASVSTILLIVSSAQASIALLNGGFEDPFQKDGKANWVPNNSSLLRLVNPYSAFPQDVRIYAYNGVRTLQLYAGGSVLQSCGPAIPGEKITFSGFYLNPSGSQLTSGDYGLLEMVFKKPDGTTLSTVALNWEDRLITPQTDSWRPVSLTATVPTGAAGVDFQIRVAKFAANNASSLLFDGFSVTSAVPEPTHLALAVFGTFGIAVIVGRTIRSRARSNGLRN
jgi:hypothetical protein